MGDVVVVEVVVGTLSWDSFFVIFSGLIPFVGEKHFSWFLRCKLGDG